MIKQFIFLILILVSLSSASAEDKKPEVKVLELNGNEAVTLPPEKLIKYYDLVDKNLRPEEDEFYVSSIYMVLGEPRALISRSTNIRSSEIYLNSIEYKVGDKIAEDLIIKGIDVKREELIIFSESKSNTYTLKISTGKGKSRLIPKTPA